MFFRNLTLMQWPASWGALLPTELAPDLAVGLAEHLSDCQLRPVGPLELHSTGFVSPFGRDSEELVHMLSEAAWLTIGTEERILPPAVVQDLLDRKVHEVEEREGRRLGGRTRRALKATLIEELLPQAFVQPGRLNAYLDFQHQLLIVDTSSRKAAEGFASEIRRAVGQFPALPLNTEVSPRSVLTGWLAEEPLPEGLHLGDECELRDPVDGGAVVRIQHLDLGSEEIAQHLEAGLQCTRLALVLDDHISFVLGEDLTVRKLRFLDGAVDSLENTEREDLLQELDARFALQVGELRRLVEVLFSAFRITRPDAAEPAPKAKRSRGAKVPDGITSITISSPAHDGQDGFSFTLTPRQFEQLGVTMEKVGEVAKHVRSTGKVSISSVQRSQKCGYNQAARLVEALENLGVVSAPDAQGRRTVLQPKGDA
jgi:recombination associated protein RdgC